MHTPLQQWEDSLFDQQQIRVWIKRDDLADPWTGGNKQRKLQHLLDGAIPPPGTGWFTFGGPFSNHLAAVARTGCIHGFPTIGYVRGYPVENPLLALLRQWGMALHFLPPAEWTAAMAQRHQRHQGWKAIAMGGADPEALEGTAAIVHEIRREMPPGPLFMAVPAGTGTTAAGMAGALTEADELLVFPALRLPDPAAWFGEVLDAYQVRPAGRIRVDGLSAGKGFGRKDTTLWASLGQLASTTGICFDPVYNGKMVGRFRQMVAEGYFPRGARVVLIHTGGTAGRLGYAWRYNLPPLPGDQSWE